VLLKWLGESADTIPQGVDRAVAISVPFDLAAGARQMETGFARTYVRHFLSTLRGKAEAKLRQYPGSFDRAAMLRARTFWEFDDAVTAPLHGFAGAGDYYARSSSLQFLSQIAVPTFLLNAADDPFLPASVLEDVREVAAMNPNLHFEVTTGGGHVGWIEGLPWQTKYYMERRSLRWLHAGE
jgi:predicted alpha/beta-fold hydrolase